MRILALILTMALAGPAHALGKPFFSVDFDAQLRMSDEQTIAMACLISAASLRAASTQPQQVVEWCSAAAKHLLRLYPQPAARPQGGTQ